MKSVQPRFYDKNLFSQDLKAISNWFESVYNSSINRSSYTNVVSLYPKQGHKDVVTLKLLDQIESRFCLDKAGYQLSKIWLVRSEENNTDETRVPYVPHIDYTRYLKVMMYIDEVSIDNGPFHFISANPDKYEHLRLSFPKNYKSLGLNKITEFPANEYIVCCGSGGSVAVFDTNTPHFAGLVKQGCQRRVIRFDFLHLDWARESNLISFISTIKKALFSR